MSEESDSKLLREPALPGTAAILLALLAPALGGGTSPMAEAVLLAGIGCLAVTLPPRGLRPGFLIGAAILLAVTLSWAWPASLNQLPFRARLEEAGFPLGWSSSPEPWVSLRAWLLLMGGLVWAGWCAGQPWSTRDRRRICEGLAGGIGVIALAAILARHRHVPGWPNGTGLGPFANRNQTATLFAMGGFLTVVCGAERLRKSGGKAMAALAIAGLAWLCLLGVYTAALALDLSRSGPLLFAGMTVAWVLMVMPPWKRKAGTLGAAAAVALLLAALFLLTGNRVLERLATSRLLDFRLKIFSDTLGMIRESPWTGTGLGVFDAIFPLYRHASILQQRVLHPESDWLWLAAEAGLPGLLAMAGLLGWMASQACRRLAHAEDWPMRLAICLACMGVLAHSFVDVPGHRLGTLMPILLLLGAAVSAKAGKNRRPGRILRGAGFAALIIGLGNAGMVALKIPEPLANGPQLLMTRAAREERAGQSGQAEADIATAMRWTPLDWRLYVQLAESEGAHGRWMAALGDFRRARFLEPNYAGLPFAEGVYWLEIAPRFAIEAWREALLRIPAQQRAELYQDMLALAFARHPDLHPALWSITWSDPSMELVYFGWASPEEFKARLGEILHEDPALTRFDSEQLRKLFPIWIAKGDAQQLALLMPARSGWVKAGYRTLAEYDAANGDLPGALDLMERYLPPPHLPPVTGITPAEAARRFEEDPGDLAAGLALYRDALAAGRDAQALDALRAMSSNADCPGYVHYLEGQLLAKQEKMAEAWKELRQCPE